ncbi:unnamed protein product [Meloidogyne enterolobii]|uniref:Uncharacterized protein n=1 Tax=Meloidogyne enterolobii TaxID=390850 RepID=A0ACB1A0I8_MELEN
MIKFTTGYKKDGCELDKCARKEASFEDGFSNLLPFAYSRNNSDIRYFTKDLFYDVNNMCADKDLCGGRCMIQTFLEVSWSKCNNFVYAHTHLIGEVKPGEKGEVKPGVLKTEFNLEINDKSFKMIFDDGSIKEFNNEIIKCVPRNEAFVKPKTWSIKNEDEDLKDKHLLVFHLLPQTASIRYKDGKHKGKLGEGRPKCSLFIHFDRPDYEFLQVDPQTTTTSTTTTTPKTEPVTTPPEATSSQTTPPEQKTTQKVQEAAPTEGGSNAWIWIIVIFVVIAVIGVAVGFYFYRINKKMKEEDEKESTKIAKKSSNEVKKDKTQPPKDSAPKEESTSKDPEQKKDSASKKDPAPDKSDAARSKQAGTTSNIPTDMMSEA